MKKTITSKSKYAILIFFLFVFVKNSSSQTYVNYVDSGRLAQVKKEGNDLWITITQGGVMKFNLLTEEVTNYTKGNSELLGNFAWDVTVDPEGNKWVAEREGIVKIDENNWTVYSDATALISPNSNNKYEIESSANGEIYVINYNSTNFMSKFDGITWEQIETGKPYLSNMNFGTDQNLWFIDGGESITKYDGTTWESFLPPQIIPAFPTDPNQFYGMNSIAFDSSGNKWVASNKGLLKLSSTSWEIFDVDNSNIPSNECFYISIDENQDIWIFTDGYISKFDGNTFTNIELDSEIFPLSSIVFNDDELWFLSGSSSWIKRGLTKFSNNNFTSYKMTNSSIVSHSVKCFYFDDNGIKWFGTQDGLVQFDGTNWENHFTNNLFFSNFINDIDKDQDGNFWLVSYRLFVFDPALGIIDTIENPGFPISYYDIIAIDENNVKWIGTNIGLKRVVNGVLESFDNPFVGKWTKAIEIDEEGHIWLGCNEGIAEFDGVDWTVHSNIPTFSIAIDTEGNKIWAGTTEGLGRFDGSSWEFFNSNNSPLTASSGKSIAIEDNSIIWFTNTLDDLVRFDGTNWSFYNDENSGIAGISTYQKVIVDEEGKKWISNSGGLSVLDDSDVIYPPLSRDLLRSKPTVSIHPNPVYDNFFIQFNEKQKGDVEINIYNVNGEKIKTYQDFIDNLSQHSMIDLSSGIYFLEIKNDTFQSIQKIIKM